jgi:hypothetical protein
MDVDLAQRAPPGVAEGVRLPSRGAHDVAGPDLTRAPPVRERHLALLDDDDLRVRVAVQLWAVTRRGLDEDQRGAGPAVVAALQLGGEAPGVEIRDGDIYVSTTPSNGVMP